MNEQMTQPDGTPRLGADVLGGGQRRFKPYPAYKDSRVEWLGEIPAHWEVKRLKGIFRVVNGSTPASGEPSFWDGDIPWVTPEDLGDLVGATIATTRRNITAAGYRSCGTTVVPAGSLVLSTRAPIGHLAIAGVDLCTNQGCRSLVFRDSASREFHYYELLAARPELESLGQGSTFRELAKGTLENVELAVPPEPEQRAIAAFLDRETAKIDALVAKKERLIELLQEKRTALITRAVTKGLDPTAPMKDSGIEWLGEIPAHWEVKPIRALARPGYKTFTDGDWIELPFIRDEGIRLIQTGNVGIGEYKEQGFRYIDEETFRAFHCTEVFPGDVLICRLADPVGRACLAPDLGCRMITSVDVCILKPASDVHAAFVVYALSSSEYLAWLSGICRGGTRDRVSRSMLGEIQVQKPPLHEQRAIAAFLDRETAKIDALIAKVREAIERLKEYRTALISAAVTGKIDVREETA